MLWRIQETGMLSSECLSFLHRHKAQLCPFAVSVFVYSMIHQKKGIGILRCIIPLQAPLSGMGRNHVELFRRPLSRPGAVKLHLASLPEGFQLDLHSSCRASP